MNLPETIIESLQSNTDMLKAYLADLNGPELLAGLPGAGGQHALWLVAHILATEDGSINGWVLRQKPTLTQPWREAARPGSIPKPEASAYPDKPTLLRTLEAVRTFTVQTIRQTPLDQWDQPSPPEAPKKSSAPPA